MGTITSIVRDGVRQRLGSVRLAPQHVPLEHEVARLEHVVRRLDARTSELLRDRAALGRVLRRLSGLLEDLKIEMLSGSTDLSPDEIAEACRVDVPGEGI